MSERITKADLYARVRNVNRRLNPDVSPMQHSRYVNVEERNGSTALDEWKRTEAEGHVCVRTITVGTKREVAEFLHAMMVGIDLSRA
jgi:hypothetical protein